MRCTDKDALIDNIESIVQEYSYRYGTLDDRMMLVLRIRDMVRDAPCLGVYDVCTIEVGKEMDDRHNIVVALEEKVRTLESEVKRLKESLNAKSGHWQFVKDDSCPALFRYKYYCSNCNQWNTYGRPEYCMRCGAHMAKQNENSFGCNGGKE